MTELKIELLEITDTDSDDVEEPCSGLLTMASGALVFRGKMLAFIKAPKAGAPKSALSEKTTFPDRHPCRIGRILRGDEECPPQG